MLAVVGVPAEQVDEALTECARDDVDIANHNAADQVILSSPVSSLRTLAEHFAARGTGRCVPLNVSAAFHSRYMSDAAKEFARYLERVDLADPGLPVISNVTGGPYLPSTVHSLLAARIRQPVRWAESMRYLLDHRVTKAVELGPGRALTGSWRVAERAHTKPVLTVRSPVPPPTVVPVQRRAPTTKPGLTAEALGSADFRRDYGTRYAYLAGAMYHGIASTDLVLRMGEAGLVGFFGAGGLPLSELVF